MVCMNKAKFRSDEESYWGYGDEERRRIGFILGFQGLVFETSTAPSKIILLRRSLGA